MTTPRIEELKPCPFCGKPAQSRLSKKKYDQLHGDEYQNPVVGCFNSNCDFRPKIERGATAACVEAWNNQTSYQAGVEAAVEMIDTWAIKSQYGMWNGDTKNPRHEMVVNVHKLREALDDTIKALETKKQEYTNPNQDNV